MIGVRALGIIRIKDLLSRFDSPTAIVRTLVGEGLSWRRQNMFRDINEALDWKHKQAAVFANPATALLPHDEFVRSWRLREGYRYRFVGIAEIRVPGDPEPYARMMSFYTNINLPDDLHADELAEWLDKRGLMETSGMNGQIVSFKTVTPLWNPEAGHLDYGEIEEI